MKYKLTKNALKAEFTNIYLSKKNNHILVTIKFNDKHYYRYNIVKLTNISTRLVDTVFKRKVILIHMYKLMDQFRNNIEVIEKEINNTNYAEVFGSPWL